MSNSNGKKSSRRAVLDLRVSKPRMSEELFAQVCPIHPKGEEAKAQMAMLNEMFGQADDILREIAKAIIEMAGDQKPDGVLLRAVSPATSQALATLLASAGMSLAAPVVHQGQTVRLLEYRHKPVGLPPVGEPVSEDLLKQLAGALGHMAQTNGGRRAVAVA